MFTGIVEELGQVLHRDGARLRVSASRVLEDVAMGASIALNGCCLTVVAWEEPGSAGTAGWWEADVSEETFTRTSLGSLQPGDPVNLERPVKLEDRMGGHLVQGHVDAVGRVVVPAPELQVEVPESLGRYLLHKVSVTLDGVSLTVVRPDRGRFSVAVIPHTMEETTLGRRAAGDPLNVEVDVMAKYTETLVSAYLADRAETQEGRDAG